MEFEEMGLLERIEYVAKEGVEYIRREMDLDEDWGGVLFMANEEEEKVKLMPIGMFFENTLTKDLVGQLVIPYALHKFKAKAFGMLVTAWTVHTDAGNVNDGDEIIDMLVPPSQHPQRTESLILFLADKTSQRFSSAEIKRPEGADHPELSEWNERDLDEQHQLGGRLWDGPIKALRGEE